MKNCPKSFFEASIHALVPGIDKLTSRLLEYFSFKEEVVPLLEKWYCTHYESILSNLRMRSQGTTASAGAFDRQVLWSSNRGAKLALHRWQGCGRSSGDLSVHNHLMPVAGIVLAGEIAQMTYPSLSVDSLLQCWLEGTVCLHPEEKMAVFSAGSAYALNADDFHRVENLLEDDSFTLFVTGPPVFGGNLHLPREGGAVQVKVAPKHVANLSRLRAGYQTAQDQAGREDLLYAARSALGDTSELGAAPPILI